MYSVDGANDVYNAFIYFIFTSGTNSTQAKRNLGVPIFLKLLF